jgi:hypothetical protein
MSSSRSKVEDKEGQPKLKDLLNCPKCALKYDREKHTPLVLPCGKTICKSCIMKNIDEENNSYECYFCHDKEHVATSKKLGDFPKNDIILVLMETNGQPSLDSSRPPSRVSFAKPTPASDNSYKFRKLNAILSQAEANSNKLEINVKQARESMLDQYANIENEIKSRTDQLIECLKEARNELFRELTANKKTALNHLEECYSFNKGKNLILIVFIKLKSNSFNK